MISSNHLMDLILYQIFHYLEHIMTKFETLTDNLQISTYIIRIEKKQTTFNVTENDIPKIKIVKRYLD